IGHAESRPECAAAREGNHQRNRHRFRAIHGTALCTRGKAIMSAKIDLLQLRVRDLILADATHFYDATIDPPPAGKVPVVMDLPGDIDAEIGKALAAAGIAVIVWQ